MGVVKRALRAGDQEPHFGGVRKVPKVSLLISAYSVQTVDRINRITSRVSRFIEGYRGHKPEVNQLRFDIQALHTHLLRNAGLARGNNEKRIELEKYADSQLTHMETLFQELTGHAKI